MRARRAGSGLPAERQRRAGFRQHAVEAAGRRAQPGRDGAAGLVEIDLAVAEIPGADAGKIAVGAAGGSGAFHLPTTDDRLGAIEAICGSCVVAGGSGSTGAGAGIAGTSATVGPE